MFDSSMWNFVAFGHAETQLLLSEVEKPLSGGHCEDLEMSAQLLCDSLSL